MSWRLENCITMLVTVAGVLGLFYMSHSWHSLWMLVFLMNMNYPIPALRDPGAEKSAP